MWSVLLTLVCDDVQNIPHRGFEYILQYGTKRSGLATGFEQEVVLTQTHECFHGKTPTSRNALGSRGIHR